MPRVSELEGAQAGVAARIVHSFYRRALGRVINPAKVAAHAPRALWSSFLSNALFGSGHPAVGGKAGLSREAIEAALDVRSVEQLTERQRLALEYADRVSATPVDVPDAFFARLRAEFSEREIVELTANIAHENYNAKFNRPLRVAANDFCDIPLPAK
jgi:hypothetical protein